MTGREVPYTEITKRLNKILRPMGAKIKTHRDITLKTSKRSTQQPFMFSGYFDTEKEKDAIVLTLHRAPNKTTHKFTKKNYDCFIFVFSQILQHEKIHESQFFFRPEQAEKKIKVYHSDKISKKRKEQIEYLREWCEVEAYAHDIAMEINTYYKDKNPEYVLRHIDKHNRYLNSYKVYTKAFKGTDWDRLRKSLLRKIWRWLPSAHGPEIS